MLMDELGYFMDWDLEAIVRGCTPTAATTTTMEDPHLNFFSHNFFSEEVQDGDLFLSFPEFSESTRVVIDELEELYKPFYPVFHTSPLSSPQPMVTNPQPIISKEISEEDVKVLKPSQKLVAAPPQDLQQVLPAVSKSKRSKKSLNKRVTKQVTAADIGVCDAWAWRKYGQKPIKGSPYPRSYYRCSSSKGCLARKQVERNHLDPSVFIVTYTSEHNHPHPTRRNSLAGSTRKNNSIVVVAPKIISTTTCSSSNSSSAVSDLSPRTPLVVQSIMEDNDEIAMTTTKGLKEEEDFVGLLDGAEEFGGDDDGWFPTAEIEEMMGLDYQQLEIDNFINGFAATAT